MIIIYVTSESRFVVRILIESRDLQGQLVMIQWICLHMLNMGYGSTLMLSDGE